MSFNSNQSRGIGPENIRNLCILAHVDHGKTSVADSLLSLNGMVSKRNVGTTKLLDSRQDEQERGITMKSSAVLLADELKAECDDVDKNIPVILNLIDTPGHIDFSTEVTAAVRISDSAIIVVDVVDGFSAQTKDAIKHAYDERLKMMLVVNKIDRLIWELKQSSVEIFNSIIRVIEDCNACIASLSHLEMSAADPEKENKETLEKEDTFAPYMGNVIFASALDGWGFTLENIARMYLNVIKGEDVLSLTKKLWNFDCYINSKTKEVNFGAITKNKPNLFIQLITSMISDMYTKVAVNGDLSQLGKIVEKLKIKNIPSYGQYGDPKTKLRVVLQAWKPLSRIILRQAYMCLPSPAALDEERVEYLLNSQSWLTLEQRQLCEKIGASLKKCDQNGDVFAYFSKKITLEKQYLKITRDEEFYDEYAPPLEREAFEIVEEKRKLDNYEVVSVARIFSGRLQCGQELLLISKDSEIKTVTINRLYILSGRKYDTVNCITAGYLCGIVFDGDVHNRTGTLTNTLPAIPIIEKTALEPILYNLVSPVNQSQFSQLVKGLKLLEQTDSGVKVTVNRTGEYILATAGEVHLEKCLQDLKEIFTHLKFNVSPPIYSLRETVDPETDPEVFKFDMKFSENCFLNVEITVLPLQVELIEAILRYSNLLRGIQRVEAPSSVDIWSRFQSENLRTLEQKIFGNDSINNTLTQMKNYLNKVCERNGCDWTFENVWCVTEQSDNVNVLVGLIPDYRYNIFVNPDENDPRIIFNNYLISAFKRITKSGPLCEEPMTNNAFIITGYTLSGDYKTLLQEDAQQTSNLKKIFYEILRNAFLAQTPALLEPILSTKIQTDFSGLGKLYSEVHKRYGRVLDNLDLDENNHTFVVKALIPSLESKGFANTVRQITSGGANPTLSFSHYQIVNTNIVKAEESDSSDELDEEEEIEESRTQKLQNLTRRRKGLPINEQIVAFAEKQRTLKK